MPNKFTNLIKSKMSEVFAALGGNPARYWNYLLLFGFLLFIGVFVADVLIFIEMRDGAFGEVFLPENIGVKSIDRPALDAAAKVVTDRGGRFEQALAEPLLKDPAK